MEKFTAKKPSCVAYDDKICFYEAKDEDVRTAVIVIGITCQLFTCGNGTKLINHFLQKTYSPTCLLY